MAKRKKAKTEHPELPPPRNMSEDLEEMTAMAAGCMSMLDSPLLGVFTVVTPVGHYDFFLDEDAANQMIQALRELLRGDSASLLEDDARD
jgi:hypothetical protein